MSPLKLQFEAIGTRWEISSPQPLTHSRQADLAAAIADRIEEFDRAYSRFRSDSLVAHMGQVAGRHELAADAYELLSVYQRLYRATGGSITPLIGQVMVDAGYDADYSFQPKTLRQPPAWEDVIKYDRYSLTLSRPTLLDFGAAGKGYLVDLVAEVIAAAGVSSFVVNAGGDILHRSATPEPLRVGLENPTNHSEAIGIASLNNQSLCASSGSRRTWGAYHHIIDPHELASPHKVLATWVVANDTLTADGLATALFFTPAADLKRYFTFSGAVLYSDMSLVSDPNFPATIFQAS